MEDHYPCVNLFDLTFCEEQLEDSDNDSEDRGIDVERVKRVVYNRIDFDLRIIIGMNLAKFLGDLGINGMKLHMVGQRRKGRIPSPEMIVLTSASENDLTVFKNGCVPYLDGETILTDKIYRYFSFLGSSNPIKVLTPHKEIKNESEVIRQREKAGRELFSQAVSKLRRPIESFFN
ncbi:MAG: hypothetical protein SOY65_04305 [Marinifilaceae bacterium]|nr:hypothetical protein [Marinifilaceae bacterium]